MIYFVDAQHRNPNKLASPVPSGLVTVADYAQLARDGGISAIASVLTSPVIVATGIVRPDRTNTPAATSFHTRHLDPSEAISRYIKPDGRRVFAIQKRGGGAFSELISVGRTQNVDVHLALDGVSKFHAHFTGSEAGVFQLVDGGSTNGTFVGGKPLIVRTPCTLQSGDEIRFGVHVFRFYSVEGFARVVLAMT